MNPLNSITLYFNIYSEMSKQNKKKAKHAFIYRKIEK